MTKEEKEKIVQFMMLVYHQLHPNQDEYPFEEMRSIELSNNKEFKDTPYENNLQLLQAYYMKEIIDTF